MKKNPIEKYEKQAKKHPIIGVMASESNARKRDYLKFGCNAFEVKKPVSRPMGFWVEQDVLQYLKINNIQYASIYGEIRESERGLYLTGVDRTGCMFCMFGCHLDKTPNRFQKMKLTHPKIYDYCMKDWEDGGLGIKRVLEYINIKVD